MFRQESGGKLSRGSVPKSKGPCCPSPYRRFKWNGDVDNSLTRFEMWFQCLDTFNKSAEWYSEYNNVCSRDCVSVGQTCYLGQTTESFPDILGGRFSAVGRPRSDNYFVPVSRPSEGKPVTLISSSPNDCYLVISRLTLPLFPLLGRLLISP